MNSQILVVGAGFSGASVARKLAEQGEDVLVMDRLGHIAGAAYDEKDQNGITVHKYGSHIFHTSNPQVWKFVRRFAQFNTYMHKVCALIDGTEAFIPFNLSTIRKLFPPTLANRLEAKLLERFDYNAKIPISEFKKQNDADLKFLANYIYEKVFLNYTKKQWGTDKVDCAVTARVPVLIGTDSRYFSDVYQGIPVGGYTRLIENMLSHKKIRVVLNRKFEGARESKKFKAVYYTGSIDEFFEYNLGMLPYRSLRFEFRTHDAPYYQSNSVVNYPCNYDFTRVHEFKYYLGENSPKTTIAYEYPQPFIDGENERFYPIETRANSALYKKYLKQAQKFENVRFLGRLGDYKYYNMDEAVERAMSIV